MEITPWTYRGPALTKEDKIAIRGLTEVSPVASQIFLTGEIKLDRIGEVGTNALLHANEKLCAYISEEPLFVMTDVGTMRMIRFDHRIVWPLLRAMLYSPVEIEAYHTAPAEVGRISALFMKGTADDFYQQLVGECFDDIYAQWHATSDENARNYFNALVVLRKDRYQDIQASEFLAINRFSDMHWGRLSEDQINQRNAVMKNTDRLTNDEILFLHDLT